jgi:hypothetical protein
VIGAMQGRRTLPIASAALLIGYVGFAVAAFA